MSAELTEKWEQIGRDILSLSRNELYIGMRFLDLALGGLKYALDPQIQTAGTDGYSLFFEPYSLAALYENDRRFINRLYLHIVLHCLFRHLSRRGGRNPEYWNLACDIAMESLIDGMDKRSVRRAVAPERTETYRMLKERLSVLTAEGIYQVLLEKRLAKKQLEALKEAFTVDDHRYWPDPEKEPDRMRELENKWRDTAEKTETGLAAARKDQGSGEGELFDRLKVQNGEREDYRSFLKKFAVWREELGIDQDSFDYGFYSYGLRLYGNMPLIEPQEFKEVKRIRDFVIAVDTSMSCSGRLVKAFLSETCGILLETESFFKKVNIHIIQCDEKVRSDTVIKEKKDLQEYMERFELKGGGGTDFRPVFSYVEELKEQGAFQKLKGLLYFTDGRGTYPKKRPDYDVAFLFMKEDYTDESVPPWAMKKILTGDDVAGSGKRLDKNIRFV